MFGQKPDRRGDGTAALHAVGERGRGGAGLAKPVCRGVGRRDGQFDIISSEGLNQGCRPLSASGRPLS
eukprot:6182703-Pleurochrysis_carterae.AAC.3